MMNSINGNYVGLKSSTLSNILPVSNGTGGKLGKVTDLLKDGNTTLDSIFSAVKMIPGWGQALGLLEGVIGKEVIGKTLGQVFSKGGGFQCWGSSWTPAKAELVLPLHWQELEQLGKEALNVPVNQLEASINSFFVTAVTTMPMDSSEIQLHRHWLLTGAENCTKRGLQKLVDGSDSFIKETSMGFKKTLEAIGIEYTNFGTQDAVLKRRGQSDKVVQVQRIKLEISKTALVSDNLQSVSKSTGFMPLALGVLFFIGRKYLK